MDLNGPVRFVCQWNVSPLPDEHGQSAGLLLELQSETVDGPQWFRFGLVSDTAGLIANELRRELDESRP